MTESSPCELCSSDGGLPIYQNALYRIVRVQDSRFPGFLRVILNRHVREMTDLPKEEQVQLLGAVLACERVLRRTVETHKVNLASLGNMTPHVHWHIIARAPTDSHFPDAVWASPRRPGQCFEALPPDGRLRELLLEELAT